MKVYVKHIILLTSLLVLLFPVGKGYAQTTADQQVPQGEQRTYSVTAEPGYEYHWSVSGGSSTDLSTSTGNSVTVTWDGNPGTYTLELSVSQIHVNTDGQQIAVCDGDPRQISVEVVEPYSFELVADHNISSMNVTAINASVFTNDFMLSLATASTKALPLATLTGNDVSASVTVQPQHGLVTMGRTDGNYSYIPAQGYTGHDFFSYQVERNGITMESSVQFEILGTNPSKQYPPVAFNDEVRAPAGTQIKSTVLNNDIDLNGDPLTVNPTPVKGPSNGTLVLNADGTYIYTPSSPNPVKDQFTYEVSDGHQTETATVQLNLYDNTKQNNPPFGGDDLFISFMSEKSGSVALNDLPVDAAHPVSYLQVSDASGQPMHGAITSWDKTTGKFTYVPNPGYVGADHFVYELNDGTHQTYATAYVYVMADLIADAGNDTTITECDGTYVANASGSQGLDLQYDWTSTTGTFENPSAQVTNYTPDGPGQHELILTVTNGSGISKSDTCVVTVTPKPQIVMAPVDPLDYGMSTILDASGTTGSGPLTYNWTTVDGTIEGVSNEPTLEISSPGSYILTVTDSSDCFAIDTVFVQAVEHPPVARDDFAATSAQEPINIAVLTNDEDQDFNLDTSSVTILLNPNYGDLTVLPDGTINYIPTQPFQGIDQFIYQVCDMTNLCDTALVTIDVSRGPFVIPEAFSPNQDGFNDTFEILGIEQYPGTVLTVYNRWQSKVYVSKDYKNDWDGKCNTGLMSNDRLLPVGTYYYVLTLGGTHKTYKGFVYIAY